MIKRKVFLLSLLLIVESIFIFSGCKKTEKEPETKEAEIEGTENKQEDIDEKLGSIDWNLEHITYTINENFVIDADIVPKSVYENEFGLYRYTINRHELSEEKNLENEIKLAEAVDSYYGKKVSFITPDMKDPHKEASNLSYSSDTDSWFFIPEDIYNTFYTEVLNVFFPVDNIKGYNEELINKKVLEVCNHFSEYILFDNYGFKCVWFGDELYDRLEAFKRQHSIDENVAFDDEFMGERRKFFEVTVREKLDNGLYIEKLDNILTKKQADEKVNPLLICNEADNTIRVSQTLNSVDIILDSEYNVKSFSGQNSIIIDEKPFKKINAVHLQDIIKKFYEKYKDMGKLTVTNVRMCYSGYMENELDENKMRDVYLAPYWTITYYLEGADTQYQCVYSAMTGEMLFSTI